MKLQFRPDEYNQARDEQLELGNDEAIDQQVFLIDCLHLL
jgi:hypothetical protein